MILRICLEFRSNLFRKYLLKYAATTTACLRTQEYKCLSSKIYSLNVACAKREILAYQNLYPTILLHRNWYCKGLINEDVNKIRKEKELKKVTELFPEARVTLHILSQRTPDKIYDVHYRQYSVGKKAIRNHEWTCSYNFVWPEKMKFESTAISKSVAAEKAALQGLHWLYSINRIDKEGRPIYDKKVIEDIKSNLEEDICAELSEISVERIEKIWNDYECGIKQIYEKTAEKAKLNAIQAPLQLTKDSTIDEEASLVRRTSGSCNSILRVVADDPKAPVLRHLMRTMFLQEMPHVSEYPDDNVLDEQMPFLSDTKELVDPVCGRVLSPPTPQALMRRAQALDRTFEKYNESITPLPIDQYAEQITTTLQDNQVCVIVGAAGCGKSTRVPAALLRHCRLGARIIVSEPRRVAAIGLAERVASELGEELGVSVGYQVRLQPRPPRAAGGALLYCTSGVLLNRLHSNPDLSGCSHVVLDEAHSRDVSTDVAALLLKRAARRNPPLRVLIMSATLDTGVFTEYFNSCPVIEVPGRTYPVETSYLEDLEKKYQLKLPNTLASCLKEDGRPQINVTEITEVVKAVDKHEEEGAILVFLPGWAEIKYAKQLLETHYAGSALHVIIPVHSRLSTADQTRMFSRLAPGIRKIVLATNVAETSVTIPDVVHVIDAGVHRENTLLRGTGTASLETVWVSLAAAKQRCGRAGRVQPGHCYRLYTKEKEAEFVPHSTPEILRIPLEQTVLDCKTYAPEDKAVDFLSQLPQPPSLKAVRLAVKDLIDIGALTPSEQLTRLGRVISSLPLAPRAALSLAHAALCSAAAAQAHAQAALDAELFERAADRRDEIRLMKRRYNETSDQCALRAIQREYESASKAGRDKLCEEYGLKRERLAYVQSLSTLYLRELLKTGLIEPHLELSDIDRLSDIDELSVATLFSGVDALFVTKRHVKTKGKLKTVNEVFSTTGERAHISSESVNYNLAKTASKPTLLASHRGRHSAERRALLLYKTSVLSPQAALLFSMGPVAEIENDGKTAVLSMIRHKLNIHVPASQSEALLKARQMLWATINYHFERDIKDLEYEEVTSVARFKIRLLKAVCRIMVEASGGEKKSNVDDLG